MNGFEDGDVILLNPRVQTTGGDWEAWWFGNKLAGAYRYPSFRELVEHYSVSAFSRV